ncbi:MAG TPA: polysaccharide biosynthesis/export family protein [Terriglobales bacterium]|jgi:polysaccharide export outer membrane protein|nr:polysaccharide biosynthesis/export family protein [Terriglobales bacterium]
MKRTWKVAMATLLLSGGMALAQDATTAPPAMASASDAAASMSSPDYVIGPEDVLHVAVWKEADLTATLPVRPDGKISLPLLNDVQAAGLTPMQLADSLTEKLKKYVASPRVTVVVSQINSKRIYLVGEVGHTGAVPMLPNMTVLQALSSAGMTQFANTKKIYVMRIQNGKQVKLPVNYKKLVKGEQMEQNYLLQPGDTVVIP